MLEIFFEELGYCGLQINAKKCKILTLNPTLHRRYSDIGNHFIEIMNVDDTHLYLGRMMSGDPLKRSESKFAHRC